MRKDNFNNKHIRGYLDPYRYESKLLFGNLPHPKTTKRTMKIAGPISVIRS
jgi:hypothetical protein